MMASADRYLLFRTNKKVYLGMKATRLEFTLFFCVSPSRGDIPESFIKKYIAINLKIHTKIDLNHYNIVLKDTLDRLE